MESKDQLRKRYKLLRRGLEEDLVCQKSQAICQRLLEDKDFLECKDFFFYAPIQKEVDVFPLALSFLKEGRNLYFPRIQGETMEFYQVKKTDDLEEGSFGVREPKNTCPIYNLNQGEKQAGLAIIIPGLAFSRSGGRIGFGKGYYDRYISRLLEAGISFYDVALAYDLQVLDSFETEEHDYKLSRIYTESTRIICNE